ADAFRDRRAARRRVGVKLSRTRVTKTFLHHNATASRGAQSAEWTVVPDSGTGELTGLRGDARIAGDPKGTHTFTLDYDLP
ncbi:MAG: DUF3224 domain-containing protein, partial [Chloroflexota bacterium]|nr:DUF3224 domain-containing protein [Chloroflexota bacterium]